jgi:hypothetical protein
MTSFMENIFLMTIKMTKMKKMNKKIFGKNKNYESERKRMGKYKET